MLVFKDDAAKAVLKVPIIFIHSGDLHSTHPPFKRLLLKGALGSIMAIKDLRDISQVGNQQGTEPKGDPADGPMAEKPFAA